MTAAMISGIVLVLLSALLVDLPVTATATARDQRFRQQMTKDHVLEELEQRINTKDRKDMTEEELQFYYFKLHDFDSNNMLDGLEIIKAIKHQHDEHEEAAASGNKTEEANDKLNDLNDETKLMGLVDNILSYDDLNRDGYVSFSEFMTMQEQREAASTADATPAPES